MSKQKVFVSCCDVGPTNALIPVIRALVERGASVMVATKSDAPARACLEAAFPKKKDETEESAEGKLVQLLIIEPNRWMPKFLKMHLFTADVVLTGFDASAEKVLRVAAEMKKPSAVVLETWPHLAVSTHGAETVHALCGQADALFVPDDASKGCLVKARFKREQVVVTGNPAHDLYAEAATQREEMRQAFRKKHGIPRDAVVVAWLVTQDLDDATVHQPGHPGWYGVPEEECLWALLAAIRTHGTSYRTMYGIVRQKPAYGTQRAQEIVSRGMRVAFDNSSDGLPALFASDIVFGVSTTMVQTAALLGIPAVYYRPGYKGPEDMISTQIGLTRVVKRVKALFGLVRGMCMDPQSARNGTLPTFRAYPRHDGVLTAGASARVAQNVLDMIAAPGPARAVAS